MRHFMKIVVLLSLAVLQSGCEDNKNAPYFEFAGGGFIFNYRNAEHYYGFVARPKRGLPDDAVLEAHFEMPGGRPPLVLTEPVRPGRLQYMFRTGHLLGIVKGHPYKVVLKLVDGKTGTELGHVEKTFATEVDQASLPEEPLVIGPGYQQPQ